MRCPYLREAQVKSCSAAAYRKFIVRNAGNSENERCSSSAYVDCPVAREHIEENPSIDHCPFLHESLVQYCAVAAVPTYIPYTESGLSRCGTDGYSYCELFAELEHAVGESAVPPPREGSDATAQIVLAEPTVDGLAVPIGLWYAPNHMWLDASEDGTYHVGIDSFMARALGTLDAVSFLTMTGLQRPAVVFSVRGVDLQAVFPAEISIRKANTYLRTNPSKVLADPFGHGWLFEGRKGRPASRERVPEGLIPGKDAARWMSLELRRLTAFARELSERPDAHGTICMADGGTLQDGVCRSLDREGVLRLWNEFFSPYAHRMKVSR